MTLPGVNISYTEGGLGGGSQTGRRYCVIGPADGGTASKEVLGTIGSVDQAQQVIGVGPCSIVAAMLNVDTGSPVDYIISSGSVAQTSGSLTSGSSVPTLDFYPTTGTEIRGDLEIEAEVTAAGAEGVAVYKVSFDGGKTYVPQRKIPSGLTESFSDLNLTLKFASDTYSVGDSWSGAVTGSQMNTTDLATCQAALKGANRRYTDIVYATNFTTSSQMTTFFPAVNSDLTELKNAGNPAACAHIFTGQGEFTSTELEQAAGEVTATDLNNIVLHAGRSHQTIDLSIPGYGKPVLPNLFAGSSKFAQVGARDLSQNPAQPTGQNAVTRMSELDYDEQKSGQVLSTVSNKVVTYRTWPNSDVVYVTQAWLKTGANSSLRYAQWGKITILAYWVAYDALKRYVNYSPNTLTDGTGFLDPTEANRIEAYANSQLKAALRQPLNSKGTKGYVNPPPDGKFLVIDRAYDVLSNDAIQGALKIYPFGNASTININISLER